MAPRTTNGQPDLTQDAANEQLVLDNLGMTAEDLGMNQGDDNDLGFDQDDDNQDGDQGSNDFNLDDQQQRGQREDDFELPPTRREQQQRSQQSEQRDDSRVSHTLHSSADVKYDKKGNLINAQGIVVARAGKEARLYVQAHTERTKAARAELAVQDIRGRFDQLTTLARNMATELQNARARDQQIQQLGLKPEEQMRAYQIFLELRDKPQEAVQKILTRAAASGIDVTKLGLEPGGFNPKSLVDMLRGEITQAMAPIQQRTQQEQQREQAAQDAEQRRATAETELNQFLTTNPEAREYLPAIHQILSRPEFKGMSLDHVWSKIQLNLLRNPQLRQQRPPNSRRNMPSGRAAPMNGNARERGGDELAPVDMSYDQIIRDAFGS